MRNSGIILLLASCALIAQPATAQEAAGVEARLAALEAEISRLKAELATAKPAAPIETATAVQAARPVPEGMRVGGSTLKIGGYVKMWAAVSRYSGGTLAPGALGRDFYLPQQVPVGGPATTHFNAHARQTRLWLSGTTPVGERTLGGYVELDFQTAPGTQGSERTTNGYNPALRRAYFTVAGRSGTLLIGQEWTTFQNVGALPETTDFIGPTEGSVFARQPQVRYTANLSPVVQLAVALENPETATISSTSAALIEHDDDQWPDAVARLTVKPGKAELTLAGILHHLNINEAGTSHGTLGYGLSGAGRIPFGPDGRHDIRFMLTWGEGIGHYLGLNFGPDAVLANGHLNKVGTVAGFAAVRLGWTERLRSTLMASFQNVDYPAVPVPLSANDSAWSIAGNLFTTPLKGFDVGVEYRHGERRLVSGESGTLSRFELAAKYSF